VTVSYATSSQVADWIAPGEAPADLARLIARASELVDSHVRATYATNTDEEPTDATVAAAMRDAVCAQVEQWIEVDETNAIDGLAGGQISVDGYSGQRAPELAPRARHILKVAGLLSPVRLSQVMPPSWEL